MGEVRGIFFITPYAVRRYVERVRPGLRARQALEEMIALTSTGRLVGPYDGEGLRAMAGEGVVIELWRAPKVGTKKNRPAQSEMRFVVAYGPGALPQVVTVLPGRRGGRRDG